MLLKMFEISIDEFLLCVTCIAQTGKTQSIQR
jgi:hypothetical protein